MFNLRFPFSFSQSPNNPQPNFPRRPTAVIVFSAAAAAAAVAGAASIIVSRQSSRSRDCFGNPFPLWGSLSLSGNAVPVVTESRTGVEFPSVVGESRKLMGVGVRRKSVLGLKNIDVYAFGIYADDSDVKKMLKEKYGKSPASEFKEDKVLIEDLVESDVSLTVRLQIVYGKLSIKSVRSAFEESVGSRLQKFSSEDNKELLHRFTSQFKDEYKIPRGSVIDLSRDQGNVLRTTINGEEVGSIESTVLCRSILDLYVGDDPFDKNAREDVRRNMAALLED
ncbi:hypothetical protein MLD38_026426 [Melastoma candidum]|uniref:Uncharacterized protein n=1 Tax=Melastoma candidum TaxID=119954 RepID=A0ACB9NYJ4_9MYRT|nr:hypothetical protein MLD38_026426 [Melastoma candidum]